MRRDDLRYAIITRPTTPPCAPSRPHTVYTTSSSATGPLVRCCNDHMPNRSRKPVLRCRYELCAAALVMCRPNRSVFEYLPSTQTGTRVPGLDERLYMVAFLCNSYNIIEKGYNNYVEFLDQDYCSCSYSSYSVRM